MRNILKTIYIFLMALFLMPFSSYAILSSENINKTIEFDNIGSETYTIPEWKDFFIRDITVTHFERNPSITEAPIKFYDWNTFVYDWLYTLGKETIKDINLIFKDSLIIESTENHLINVSYNGFLINEDEEIISYLQNNSNAWNKHIFNKEDIDLIYFREFIIFFFLAFFKFISIIIWRRFNIFF